MLPPSTLGAHRSRAHGKALRALGPGKLGLQGGGGAPVSPADRGRGWGLAGAAAGPSRAGSGPGSQSQPGEQGSRPCRTTVGRAATRETEDS